jgi:hypothetical protein
MFRHSPLLQSQPFLLERFSVKISFMLPHLMLWFFHKIFLFSVLCFYLFLLSRDVTRLIWAFFVGLCSDWKGFEGAQVGWPCLVLLGGQRWREAGVTMATSSPLWSRWRSAMVQRRGGREAAVGGVLLPRPLRSCLSPNSPSLTTSIAVSFAPNSSPACCSSPTTSAAATAWEAAEHHRPLDLLCRYVASYLISLLPWISHVSI